MEFRKPVAWDLDSLVQKRIVVQLLRDREVTGILINYDDAGNLILDDAVVRFPMAADPDAEGRDGDVVEYGTRKYGTCVLRAPKITTVGLREADAR